jgi:hypothetical protein
VDTLARLIACLEAADAAIAAAEAAAVFARRPSDLPSIPEEDEDSYLGCSAKAE